MCRVLSWTATDQVGLTWMEQGPEAPFVNPLTEKTRGM